jgi:transposase-like protein
MIFEHAHEHPSQWKAIESIAEKLDISRETLRVWVRRGLRSTRAAGRDSRPTSVLG